MDSNKRILINTVTIAIMIVLLTGVTYAFFNYTRTGASNTIKTGRISFSSNQDNTLNLTNIFPMTSSEASSANLDTLTITIDGDTTYSEGEEFLVTITDVNNTINNKKIPINYIASYEAQENKSIGESSDDYYNERETGDIYSLNSDGIVVEDERILVSHINSVNEGVHGILTIKTYIDEDRIAISDTYPAESTDTNNDGYINGTELSFGEGKTVFTTTEWNSLTTNSISFKIKIESNEGVWVEDSINVMNYLNYSNKTGIKEIHFIKESSKRMQERYNTAEGEKVDLTLNNEGKVLGWREDDTLFIASNGETYLTIGAGLFVGFNDVEEIIFDNVNSSRITSMQSMFYGCSNLTHIDLSWMDTQNVTDMSNMFYGCSSLDSIDLSGLGSSSLTSVSSIFSGCINLKDVDMSGFNFGNVTNVSGMFSAITALRTVDLSGANTSNIQNMSSMFINCSSLVNVNLDNDNLSSVKNVSAMFYGCSSLVSINLSGVGSSSLTSVSSMFSGCNNLKDVDMSGFNFGTASMSNLFTNLSNLETVNLTNANTSGVSNMSYLFSGCSKIERLDLSTLNTENVTNLSKIFMYMTNLKYVNLSGLGSDYLNLLGDAFLGCNNLETIIMSGFNFGTASPSGYSGFSGLSKLKTVDLSNANLSRVTSFYETFSNCTSLVSIDLSGVSIPNASSTQKMFYNCGNLTTIYVSNIWDTNNVQYSNDMFYNCTSLVGGNGTTYDSTKTDKEYAHIDGGPSNPGYLTLKTN